MATQMVIANRAYR